MNEHRVSRNVLDLVRTKWTHTSTQVSPNCNIVILPKYSDNMTVKTEKRGHFENSGLFFIQNMISMFPKFKLKSSSGQATIWCFNAGQAFMNNFIKICWLLLE